jgi:putative membrane protein
VSLLFLASLQGVLLAMLMIFAGQAWYSVYAGGAADAGVTALTDQQLAGVLLWLPASGLYALTAVVVLARSLRDPGDTAWPARASTSSTPHPS